MKNKKASSFTKLEEFRLDTKLSSSAKILYAEILALSQELGICYASNKHFIDLFGKSKSSINNWLRELEKNNYIKRHIYRRPGSKEICHRYITNLHYPSAINLNRPIAEIWTGNIQITNRKSNIQVNSKKNNLINSQENKLCPRR